MGAGKIPRPFFNLWNYGNVGINQDRRSKQDRNNLVVRVDSITRISFAVENQ